MDPTAHPVNHWIQPAPIRLAERLDRPVARRIVALAIALGVLVEVAFDGPAYGINVPLVVGALLAAGWFCRRRDRAPDRLDAWLPVTSIVLAILVAVRGDEFLAGLDIAWSFVFLGGSLLAFSGVPVTRRSASLIAAMGAWSVVSLGVGAFRAIVGVRPPSIADAVPAGTVDRVAAVVRGLVIAIPLALIFAVLFASADPIFRRTIADLIGFRVDLGDLPGRIIVALSAAWLAAGALTLAAQGIPDVAFPSLGAAAWTPVEAGSRGLRRSLGRWEALVILGTIDLVVGLFVGLQVAYLFGGLDTLAAAGVTYADYARRGFFELVAAACLAAVVVVTLEAVVDRRSRLYVTALLTLVGLTGAVLLSAAMRLRLYQDAYGWTELRLYVLVAIATMGVGLVAMTALIVTDRSRWLGHALAVIGVVSLVTLNVIAPGSFVAERNIERVLVPGLVPPDGHPGLDSAYLFMLPDDAIPATVAALPALTGDLRDAVTLSLQVRRAQFDLDPAFASPLAWNLGRERAREALDTLP